MAWHWLFLSIVYRKKSLAMANNETNFLKAAIVYFNHAGNNIGLI